MDPVTLGIIGSTVLGAGANIWGANSQSHTNAANLAASQGNRQQLLGMIQQQMMGGRNPYAQAYQGMLNGLNPAPGQNAPGQQGQGGLAAPSYPLQGSVGGIPAAPGPAASWQSMFAGSGAGHGPYAALLAAQQQGASKDQVMQELWNQGLRTQADYQNYGISGLIQGYQPQVQAPQAVAQQSGGLPWWMMNQAAGGGGGTIQAPGASYLMANNGFGALDGDQNTNVPGDTPQNPGGTGTPGAATPPPVGSPLYPWYTGPTGPTGPTTTQQAVNAPGAFNPLSMQVAQGFGQYTPTQIQAAPSITGGPQVTAQTVGGGLIAPLPSLAAPQAAAAGNVTANQLGALPALQAPQASTVAGVNAPQISTPQATAAGSVFAGQLAGLPQVEAAGIGAAPSIGQAGNVSVPSIQAPPSVGTQFMNTGQDALMQMLQSGPSPVVDPSQIGLMQQAYAPRTFDNSGLAASLQALAGQNLNEQVSQLQGSAGSLGARFGTALNRNEALLRSNVQNNLNATLGQLSSQSFENAQGRSLSALGQLMQGANAQNQFNLGVYGQQGSMAQAAGGLGLQGAQLGQQGQAINAANSLTAQQGNASNALQAGLGQLSANTQTGIANAGNQLSLQQLAAQQQFGASSANAANAMQSGQFNISSALQAALANQGVGQQTALANLSAAQQTGQFNAGNALQASLANQGVNQQTSLANLTAALQAAMQSQQLGYQGGVSNQQAALQAALANQGVGQQTNLANQAAALQAGIQGQQLGYQGAAANQQAALQAALANQSAGLQAGQFNSTQNYQAQLANQNMLAQLYTNNAGIANQGAQFNAGMGMQGAQFNAGQGQAYNQLVMGLLGQSQSAQMGQNQFNAGLLSLLAGLPMPQQQASPYPAVISGIGDSAMTLPFLLQFMNQGNRGGYSPQPVSTGQSMYWG